MTQTLLATPLTDTSLFYFLPLPQFTVTSIARSRGRPQRGATKSASSTQDIIDADVSCTRCGNTVTLQTKALQCDVCDSWECTTCNKMPDELYTHLQDQSGFSLRFTCQGCKTTLPSLTKISSSIDKIIENQHKSDKRLSDLD